MTERLETATTSGTAIQWSLAKGPCADGHAEEKTFIAELRVGNEQAFEVLLDRLSGVRCLDLQDPSYRIERRRKRWCKTPGSRRFGA